MAKRVNAVHDSNILKSSGLIWRGLLRIRNQRLLSNYFLMVTRLNVVHDSQSPRWSVLMWRILLQVWHHRFCNNHLLILKRLSVVYFNKKLRNIGADLKRSVSNMKPTCSATTGFLWWKVPCCPWRPKHGIIGTALKTSASNMKPTFSATTIVLTVKRLSVVHDSKNLGTSALISRGLLRIRNQQYLQQPFSCGETSRCRPRQPKPRIIGDDLKRSA